MNVEPVTGTFGAEVSGVDLAAPSEGDINAIGDALAEHQVLFFGDVTLSIDEFEQMALSLGEFGDTPYLTPLPDHPNVVRVAREADESGPLFGSGWHSDWSFQPAPPAATLLYAVDVPPAGGDTVFASMQLAYESLSDTMKALLVPLRAQHSARRSYGPSGVFGRYDPASAMAIHGDDSALEVRSHPLVRTHPITGRKSLFVNDVYTVGIEGLTGAEAQPLLDFLLAQGRRVENSMRIRWKPNSLTMWDNRSVQHFAVNDYAGHRRECYRITLAGEVPE